MFSESKVIAKKNSIEAAVRNAENLERQGKDASYYRTLQKKFETELDVAVAEYNAEKTAEEIRKAQKAQGEGSHKKGSSGSGGIPAIGYILIPLLIYELIKMGLEKERRENPDAFWGRAITIGILIGLVFAFLLPSFVEGHDAKDFAILCGVLTMPLFAVLDYFLLTLRYERKQKANAIVQELVSNHEKM